MRKRTLGIGGRVNSAQGLSVLLLLLVYVAVDLEDSSDRSYDVLFQARRAYAEEAAKRAIEEFRAKAQNREIDAASGRLTICSPSGSEPAEREVALEEFVRGFKGRRYRKEALGIGVVSVDVVTRKVRQEDGTEETVGPDLHVETTRPDGGRWLVVIKHWPDLTWLCAQALDPRGRLAAFFDHAAAAGITVPGEAPERTENLDRLFREVEEKLLGATISLPGVGLEFSISRSLWACLLLTLVILTLIRSRLRGALAEPGTAGGEPWLLLEGRIGMERWLAAAWALGILFSPWIVGGALLKATSDGMWADGFSSGLLEDLARPSAVVALTAAAGWIALTTLSMIVELRGSVPSANRGGDGSKRRGRGSLWGPRLRGFPRNDEPLPARRRRGD